MHPEKGGWEGRNLASRFDTRVGNLILYRGGGVGGFKTNCLEIMLKRGIRHHLCICSG